MAVFLAWPKGEHTTPVFYVNDVTWYYPSMNKTELMLQNRHGKRMPATLYTPERAPQGTLVMLHGLGGWKDQEVVVAAAHAAVSAGYQALTFDFADGANGPDGDFTTSTTSGALRDLDDTLSAIEKLPWYTEPLILGGHSQGGLVVMRFVSEHPGLAEKLVLIAPAVSWWTAALAAGAYGFALVLWLFAWLTSGLTNWNGPDGRTLKIGRPWLFDFFSYDGIKYAKSITVPVLVVSAGCDMTVATPKYHAKLIPHFKQATHIIVDNAAHHFPKRGSDVTAIVSSWLTSS